MRIYNYSMHGCGTVMVTPGAHHPETSDWMKTSCGQDGKEFKEPIMFTIRFKDGTTDVPENLARYLFKHGLAQKSPIIQAAA